ncbi:MULTISPECIES: class I SAM-dependent methyltransferase [Glycomyces]|uniref:Methyltransferase domain-containing protein n=1 Tax=Glycomyces lechevalierae TaxID=256034 RepID=A0A9X3PJ83_9ACTN|nr:class I SAM-dependent methyltransferase [Glycomyces lechevalierae]MDA1385009.1 methyltransferase domain-containing protein [Glycomyces lechevalierae]
MLGLKPAFGEPIQEILASPAADDLLESGVDGAALRKGAEDLGSLGAEFIIEIDSDPRHRFDLLNLVEREDRALLLRRSVARRNMPESVGMETESDVQAQRDFMYGELDLGSLTIFSGSFINYGYWDQLDPGHEISVEERTASQAELYRQVVSRLEPQAGQRLLELGSGIGVGAALVARQFGTSVSGLDRSPAQLARAAEVNAKALKELPLSYHEGSVTEIPWDEGTFDGLYSVEMLQHVDDLAAVAREAHRVLKPGGNFAVATFFSPDGADTSQVADLIETVASGVDVIRPVGEFAADLTAAGFGEITVTSIGTHVWRQFDQWVGQTEHRDSWGRNWLRCFESGWVDYFIVTARR